MLNQFVAPFLNRRANFSFNAKVYMAALGNDMGFDELIEGSRFIVKVALPGSVRIEANDNQFLDQRLHIGNPFDVFVSDGYKQLEVARALNVYIQRRANSNLQALRSTYGLPESVGLHRIFTYSLGFGIVSQQIMLNDLPTTVFCRRDSIMAKNAMERIYISTQTKLPVRWSVLDRGSWLLCENIREIHRVDYSEWNFDADIPTSTFDILPPYGGKSRSGY